MPLSSFAYRITTQDWENLSALQHHVKYSETIQRNIVDELRKHPPAKILGKISCNNMYKSVNHPWMNGAGGIGLLIDHP